MDGVRILTVLASLIVSNGNSGANELALTSSSDFGFTVSWGKAGCSAGTKYNVILDEADGPNVWTDVTENTSISYDGLAQHAGYTITVEVNATGSCASAVWSQAICGLPTNGTFSYPGISPDGPFHFVAGSIVDYQCTENLDPAEPSVTCEQSGLWSGLAPICTGCVSLEYEVEELLNGNLNVTFNVTYVTSEDMTCVATWGDGQGSTERNKAATTDTEIAPPIFLNHVFSKCEPIRTSQVICSSASLYCESYPNRDFFAFRFKDRSSPLWAYVTNDLDIKAVFVPSSNQRQPSLIWDGEITLINGYPFSYGSFNDKATLRIDKGTVAPGNYELNLTARWSGPNRLFCDKMYVEIRKPPVKAIVATDGQKVSVRSGQVITIDGSRSYDPAENITGIHTGEEQFLWSCLATDVSEDKIDLELVTRTNSLTGQDCNVTLASNTSSIQQLNSSDLDSGLWYVFRLVFSRDERNDSAVQALKRVDEAAPDITLRCVYNCFPTGFRKIAKDALEMEVIIGDGITDLEKFVFQWNLTLFVETNQTFVDVPVSNESFTGQTKSGFEIPGSMFQEGGRYIVSVKVTDTNTRLTSFASDAFVVNYIPHSGTCTATHDTPISATVGFVDVNCTGWQDEDERPARNVNEDENPTLMYVIMQETAGDTVAEILKISYTNFASVVLRLGDQDNGFLTTVIVRVTDIYDNYYEWKQDLNVQPQIQLKSDDVNAWADDLTTFLQPWLDQIDLYNGHGDHDTALATVVSSSSQINRINNTHRPKPQLSSIDDIFNSIIDNGNSSDVFGSVHNQSTIDEDLDPVSVLCQNWIEQMVIKLNESVEEKASDRNKLLEMRQYLRKMANAFTNIVMDKYHVNNVTKLYVSEFLAYVSLLLEDKLNRSGNIPEFKDTIDSTAHVSRVSGTISIPEKLTGAITVFSVENARHQLEFRQDIRTNRIEQEKLLEREVSYVFYKAQKKLKYDIKLNYEENKKIAGNILENIVKSKPPGSICTNCNRSFGPEKSRNLLLGTAKDILDRPVATQTGTRVDFKGLDKYGDELVSASVSEIKQNIFNYDTTLKSSLVTSKVIHVEIRSQTNESLSTLDDISCEQPVQVPNTVRVVPAIDPEDASQFSIHKVLYRASVDYLCVKIRPASRDQVEKYSIYLKMNDAPTIIDYDAVREISAVGDENTCFDPSVFRQRTGIAYLGVRIELKGGGNDGPYPDYLFTAMTSGCLAWDSNTEVWLEDMCEMEWKPERSAVVCHCHNVPYPIVANTFSAAPNRIDFSSVFLRFSPQSQAAVLSVLSITFTFYIILLICVVRMDRADGVKWGLTKLLDNDPTDAYLYILSVYTGLRPEAGTKSRVMCVLSGNQGVSEIRQMDDGIRQHFKTGSIMNFLMTTNSSLGKLEYMRIWHDNSGPGEYASWYLSKILVYDVQTNTRVLSLDHYVDIPLGKIELADCNFQFNCQRWLSIEEGDSSIHCILPVTKTGNDNTFKSRFHFQIRNYLCDSHTWTSIFYRPVHSRFTRAQRTGCSLVYIMLNMITNAMFYNPKPDYQTPAFFEAGPLRVSAYQIYVATVAVVITAPSLILVTILFKYSKPRHETKKDDKNDYSNDNNHRKSPFYCGCWQRCNNAYHEDGTIIQLQSQKGPLSFPYWCLYISWVIVLVGVIVPAFFVILFSIEWGKQKSEEWLSSFLISLLESLLLLDPLKLILLSVFLALICKKEGDKIGDIDRSAVCKDGSPIKEEKVSAGLTRLPTPPLSEDELQKARQAQKEESQLRLALRDVLVNALFLWLILSLSYDINYDGTFYMYRDITSNMLNPDIKGRQTFDKITNTKQFFNWMIESAIPALFPVTLANNETIEYNERDLKEFTNGFNNYRIGPPRLRQVRIKNVTCNIPYIGDDVCNLDYSLEEEETGSFCIGWTPLPCDLGAFVDMDTTGAWTFTSSIDIWGIPVYGKHKTYGGGGYIAPLDVNRDITENIIQELSDNLWIDKQTRAVFFEFTLYNVNKKIFVYTMLLIEFPETGGAVTMYFILPVRLMDHLSLEIYTIICQVLFLICLLLLAFHITFRCYKLKWNYFDTLGRNIDIVIFILGLAATIMYILRRVVASLTIEKFNEDKLSFVNFQHIAVWEQVFIAVVGCLVFIVTLRFLTILGNTRRIGSVMQIFRDCASNLIWFSMFFGYVFLGYALLGWLLFGMSLPSYQTVHHAMETLFLSLIGKNRLSQMEEVDPVVARIYFFGFIFVMLFFVLTLYLTILCESISKVHQKDREKRVRDLVQYLLEKTVALFKKQNASTQTRKGVDVKDVVVEEISETQKEGNIKNVLPSNDHVQVRTERTNEETENVQRLDEIAEQNLSSNEKDKDLNNSEHNKSRTSKKTNQTMKTDVNISGPKRKGNKTQPTEKGFNENANDERKNTAVTVVDLEG